MLCLLPSLPLVLKPQLKHEWAAQGVASLGQRDPHSQILQAKEENSTFPCFLSKPLLLIHIKLAQTSVYFTMSSTSVYLWFEIHIILF